MPRKPSAPPLQGFGKIRIREGNSSVTETLCLDYRAAPLAPVSSSKFFATQGVRSLKILLADWKLALTMGAAAIAAAAMIGYAFFRPTEPPEAIERKRRLHLNQIGRIAEGQVVDLVEHPPEPPAPKKISFSSRARPLAHSGPRHLVSYSYAISGVTYHTAQDITGLESQVRFERLVTGQPASIKYDPANPSDSILVADDWSGLR
jgi:hypothetical protein